MHQKIQSTLRFNVEGLSLTGVTKPEFYFRQRAGSFFQYVPEIINENTIDVSVPFDDAMELMTGEVMCQLALTSANGTPLMTPWITIPVDECLKRGGYRG